MPDLTRREFLHAVAASTVGAVVFTGCQPVAREGRVESRLLSAEDTLSANEDWFATTCLGCSAGCGLIVRVVEGRARKAEGNPDHPVNAGKLCARGQAVVQAQYHPDRLTGPQRRTEPSRSAARFAPIDWNAGLDRLVAALRDAQGRIALVTPPLRGERAAIVERFCSALAARWLRFDPLAEAPLRAAMERVYGQPSLPDLDLEHADLVLSFGADFLGTWLSPVRFGRQYGAFRHGDRPRGYLVALEPRLSPTAANADEWIPTRPGTEGLLALSMASVLTGERAEFAPEQTQPVTGVPAERVRSLAERFRAAARPLAIGGGAIGAQTNGTAQLAAIFSLNALVNAQAVRLGAPDMRPQSPLREWRDFTEQLAAGRIDALLIWDANLAYGLPSSLGIDTALLAHPGLTVSFTGVLDETSALADLLLPTHQSLEDWGDDVPEPAPPGQTLSLQQPLLSPLYDTRGFIDVLLTVADEIGGGAREALPWPTFKDALRDRVRRIPHDGDFDRFWIGLLQRGGWWDASPALAAAPGTPALAWTAPAFDGDPAEYPFHLLVFPHHTLGDGRGAYLPWLQATPDPLTSVVWQTWVEINPRVAARLSLTEGDIVALESTTGRIEVPTYVHPAAPPDVLAVPLGQGHRFGRWARDRGANPMHLLAPLEDAGSGALAYGATRVRMTKTGRRVGVPKFEGTVPAYQVQEREVIRISGR